jgi:hypothetical protein
MTQSDAEVGHFGVLGLAEPSEGSVEDDTAEALTEVIHAADDRHDATLACFVGLLTRDRQRNPDALALTLTAAVPEALRHHRDLGVPRDVTDATLADVGGKIRAYGDDVDVPWLVGLFRADVLTLGRLQFERQEHEGKRAIHIPEDGPLDPRLVDESLSRGREMFGQGRFTCTSWLLDPALRELPEHSNIVTFAARFDIVGSEEHADADEGNSAVAKFVFRRPFSDLMADSGVTAGTSLERLVLERLRSGYRWSEPEGILR